MAIILPPAMEAALEAIVSFDGGRPAVLVEDGTFREGEGSWRETLNAHRASLEQALAGVGRLEAPGTGLPFIGTAFVIDKRLAVTANYVAETAAPRRAGSSSGADRDAVENVWLDLKAEHGSAAHERIAVRRIRFVHPYWGFAFLELERDVEAERILKLAEKQSDEELLGRDICVIGYPAADPRNAADQMHVIFRDIFGVKRLMPGKITGAGQWGEEKSAALLHDASTVGGTGGAPLVDIGSGTVVGVQLGGQYLKANFAVPAWEILRDPQWWQNFSGDRKPAADASDAPRRTIKVSDELGQPLFSFEEILTLHEAMVQAGMHEYAGLTRGLPTAYVDSVVSEGAPAARLLAMLHGMNSGIRIGEHSPFYYVLNNVASLRSFEKKWKEYLSVLLEREQQAK